VIVDGVDAPNEPPGSPGGGTTRTRLPFWVRLPLHLLTLVGVMVFQFPGALIGLLIAIAQFVLGIAPSITAAPKAMQAPRTHRPAAM
jgi:hypothetical protein